MILTNIIKFKVSGTTHIGYLRKIGINSKLGDIIELNIKQLPITSNIIILAKCDICGKEKNTSYHNYNRNYKCNSLYSCSRICSKIKVKYTLLERYGYDNYNNIEKSKKTCLERYGVEHVLQSDEIKNKILDTLKNTYSVINVSQIQEVKDKKKKTCLERYGVENISQSEEIKKKKIKTSLSNYGVESPMQNKEVFNKQQETSFKTHLYNDTNIHYQASYELDFLNNYCGKYVIENGPSIKYKFEGKNKVYHSDFYLPKYNLIVEIKSDYTYEKYLDQNLEKQKECIKQGYNFVFIINKNYNVLEKYT